MVRFLNPKNPDDQVELLRRCIGTGFGQIPTTKVAQIIAEKSQKNMKKVVKKAISKGETVTVDDLVNPLNKSPKYLEFCKELGLDIPFFEGLAEGVIKEAKGIRTK